MAKIIGLTGGSGAGKSVFSAHLRRLGARVVDADAVYHALLASNADMVSEIAHAFPGAVRDGAVDRRALAKAAFGDDAALARLNAITHQYVTAAIRREIEERPPAQVLALEAIYLVESGLSRLCDITVAVTAPPSQRVARLVARDGLDEDSARLRLSRQKPDGFYIRHCGRAVENSRGEAELCRQAEAIFKEALL